MGSSRLAIPRAMIRFRLLPSPVWRARTRLARWAGKFDFVVVDESHHAVSPTWARVLASQPFARVLGATATPLRLDGRGLREQFGVMVEGPSTVELIKDGWLAPFTVFEPTAPDMSTAKIRAGDFSIEDQRKAMNHVVIGGAVVEYQRICPGVPAVVFCVDIQHSMAVAERFRAAGVKAAHVDGETPAAERRALIAALGNGSINVICNCGLVSEGVDIPAIGAAIMLRPTASLALYLQQVGRALRPAPGKHKALILDFAGNTARHGMPDQPREWSLDTKPTRQREKPEGQRLRRCPSCTALNRPSAHSCANCGADLRTARERREVEMVLRLAEQREVEAKVRNMSYGARLAWARGDEQRLLLVERACGYKRGWTWHRLRELAEQRGERRA